MFLESVGIGMAVGIAFSSVHEWVETNETIEDQFYLIGIFYFIKLRNKRKYKIIDVTRLMQLSFSLKYGIYIPV